MFLKSLTITYGDGDIVRDIQFHAGLNLIVDETPIVNGTETGNNVGKTTVLKLIDFCLGAEAKGIQYVASILKDKLPKELNKDEYVILKLSQGNKLFRIEEGN